MNYNIYTQCCGLILTIIVLIFFLTQKKLKSKNEKNFKLILYGSVLLFITDIISTILIYEIPENIFTLIISKAYLIILLGVLFLTLVYVAGATFPKKLYRLIEIISYSGLVISTIVLSILRLDLISGEDYIYTAGPAATYCYIIAVAVVIFICFLSIRYRVEMNRDRSKLLLLWMGIWTLMAAVQFFFPKILVVSFAVSIGLMIIFIKFEDLEGEIDKNSGLFNFYSFITYVSSLKRLGMKTHMVYLMPNENMYKLDEKIIENGKKQLNNKLAKMKDASAFILEDKYLITFDIEYDNIKSILVQSRDETYYVGHYYEAYYFDDVTKIDNQNDINSIIKYYNSKHNDDNLSHVISDEIIKDYYSIGIIEKLINECIEKDRVLVYLQPIFSTKLKKIVTAEALCRLVDSDGKIVQPSVFIPVAEKNGSINQLDEIVFDKVCSFISQYDMDKNGLQYIECNLSVVQLSDENLADRYINIVKKNNINPKYINLEITESAGIEKINSLRKNLAKFISFGISLSLDDYGTGYSNLNYVATMPVQIVKFDKEMTDSYFKGSKSKFVMDYSIRMFKAMDLKVVSEGVETESQLKELSLLGVDYIQGYYFSKPLPIEDFIEFMKNFKYEEDMDK